MSFARRPEIRPGHARDGENQCSKKPKGVQAATLMFDVGRHKTVRSLGGQQLLSDLAVADNAAADLAEQHMLVDNNAFPGRLVVDDQE